METAVEVKLNRRHLRIGNYLQTQITHMQKTTTQPLIVVIEELKTLKPALRYMQGAHLTMNTTHLFYSELSGIPLTPRLLEKIGFIHKNYFGVEDYFENASIRLRYKNGTLEHMYSYSDKGLQVDSLHQLQNLYFALTGNELEITL